MIKLNDIIRLCQQYPVDHDNPSYVLAGGSALLPLLKLHKPYRTHSDIDIFSFRSDDFQLGILPPLLYASLCHNGTIGEHQKNTIEVQLIRNSYFHNELCPNLNDVRHIVIEDATIPVVSPEWLAINKLSFPSIHRRHDFEDVFLLNQHQQLKRNDYLAELLSKTSLGKFISVDDVLTIHNWKAVEALIDKILSKAIHSFLYWQGVYIETLHPFQVFLFLDLDPASFENINDIDEFIAHQTEGRGLPANALQLAKLNLYFLLLGIPQIIRSSLTNNKSFIQLLQQLLYFPPDRSLVSTKTIFLSLTVLQDIENLFTSEEKKDVSNFIWDADFLINILYQILFSKCSVFEFLAFIKDLAVDLGVSDDPVQLLKARLSKYKQPINHQDINHPSTCKNYRWLFVKRQLGKYPNHSKHGGKWVFTVPPNEVDGTWQKISNDVAKGNLGGFAKVTTKSEFNEPDNHTERVICVYTYDKRDQIDKDRIRSRLYELGFIDEVTYKSDAP